MATRRKVGNPFRGVLDVMSEMNRMSDQMAGLDTSTETQQRGYMDAWNPTTDIYASGSDVFIRCELPGVGSEDVEVTFSNGTLSISGERQLNDAQDTIYYVRERFWGRFRRDITLPEGVEEDQIEAGVDEGLLEVKVRDCAEAPGPTAIQVKGGGRRRG